MRKPAWAASGLENDIALVEASDGLEAKYATPIKRE
jgi:hypothetical protein